MDDPTSLNSARTILRTVTEMSDPIERERYLVRACRNNPALFANVKSLMQEDPDEQCPPPEEEEDSTSSAATGFAPAGFGALPTQQDDDSQKHAAASPLGSSTNNLPPELTPDSMIGPYKVREPLGEGGMGIVYIAEQTRPVKRLVALKIIKPGMDTKQVIARFEAERQVLAMMDHPNIAKIFDAGMVGARPEWKPAPDVMRESDLTIPTGAADDHAGKGLPYFAMELVKGKPITEFCDDQEMQTRERLELFATVCRAVQHAHHKGIIHRDLKPSNVLVELHDVSPVPKIIDFGVAKAINQRLTEETVYTHFSQLIGTPMYMSPEQAQLSGLDVDTRSDVYSLGVLLYVLLTGAAPFEKQELQRKSLDEMLRHIREVDPPRPSQKISTLNAELASTVSNSRGTDRRNLAMSLKRELDWIVMKALEKDRSRRYQSAAALALDIENYLHNEPVLACPPSISYRLRKYAMRHRTLISSAALVLLTAIIGVVFSIGYARKAYHAKLESDRSLLIAEGAAADAEKARSESQAMLYAASMKLAADAVETGDTPRATQLIERNHPNTGEPDRRGLEWYMLDKFVRPPPQLFIEREGLITDSNEDLVDREYWISDIKISPDGHWMAANDPNGSIQIYETQEFSPSERIATQGQAVNGLAWSPDGDQLAAACKDGRIFICNFPFDNQPRWIEAHDGEAKSVVFDPESRTIYSCGDDHLAKQFDLATGKLEREFRIHSRAVEQLSLSHNGRFLATVSSDQSLAIWNVENGKLLHHVQPSNGRMVCVAFSPDDRLIAAGSIYGFLHVVDAKSGKMWQYPRLVDGVGAVAFLNGWIAIADRGGAIQIMAATDLFTRGKRLSSRPLMRWIAHQGRAEALAFCNDGRQLISGGRDGRLRAWKPELSGTYWQIGPAEEQFDLSFGTNQQVFVAGTSLSIWDLRTQRSILEFGKADSSWELVECSPDGLYLAAARRGEVALFDTKTRDRLNSWAVDPHLDPHRMAISDDGRMIAMSDFAEKEFVRLFYRGDVQPVRLLPALTCNALDFSPDGKWLAAGHLNDTKLFSLEEHRAPVPFKGHSDTLSGVAFSPDGKWLATVSHDRLLKVRSFPDLELKFSVVAHRDWVRHVAYTADGRTIVTVGDDQRVRFWQPATGQPLGQLPEEEIEIRKVALSTSQQHLGLVSVYEGDALIIYDATRRVDTE